MAAQAVSPVEVPSRSTIRFHTRTLEWAALASILLVALALRLINLGDNPGWYTDEATHIDIVQRLLRGDYGYMALRDSPLIVSRMPLFHLLLLPIYSVVGTEYGMATLRTVTAVLGTISVAMVYLLARRQSLRLALLAACALAILPQAVLYNRLAYSYNLLAPFMLLVAYCLTRYFEQNNWLWVAGAAVVMGLGLVSDIIAITFLLVYAVALIRRPRMLLLSAPLIAIPFVIYAVIMLSHSPDIWLFDVHHIINRLRLSTSIARQLEYTVTNIALWFIQPAWVIGMIGVFLLPAKLRWRVVLFLWVPYFSAGRSNSFVDLGAYYTIPMLPFLALGCAGFGMWLLDGVERRFARAAHKGKTFNPVLKWAVPVLLIILPITFTLVTDVNAVFNGFQTRINPFLMPAADVEAVAGYVNTHSTVNDVIVTTPTVGWLLDGYAIDFEMVPALMNGVGTPHLPDNIPPQRAAFNPDYRAARFVIIDDTWRIWGKENVPGLAAVMDDVEADWLPVYEVGSYVVYEQR